jgi:hypothetical protein
MGERSANSKKNVFESINKAIKMTPNYCHNSEQGKLRRYTPMEHQSTSEGMRQRITRGAYSSSNKKKISIGGYDVVAEYGNATKQSAG